MQNNDFPYDCILQHITQTKQPLSERLVSVVLWPFGIFITVEISFLTLIFVYNFPLILNCSFFWPIKMTPLISQ